MGQVRDIIPVQIRYGTHNVKVADLTVAVEQMKDHDTNKKCLYFTLTKEDDPLFFYFLNLDEDDYQKLKSEQNIRVEFNGFCENVGKLVERCRDRDGVKAKYIAGFDTGLADCALFTVTKENQFRVLTHISLKFQLGSDSTVKKHLAECLRNEKMGCAKLRDSLHNWEIEVARLSSDLDELRAQRQKEHTDSTRNLHDEKERLLKQQRLHADKYEERLSEVEKKYQDEIDALKTELKDKSVAFNEASSSLRRLEIDYEEATSKLAVSQKQCSVLEETHEEQLGKARQLDATLSEREAELNELRIHVRGLETSVKDKEELSVKTEQVTAGLLNQKAVLEEQVSSCKATNAAAEEKIKRCSEEIVKGNKIISRLQLDLRNAHSKSKTHKHTIEEMQALIVKMENEANNLVREKQDVETRFSQTENEVSRGKAREQQLTEQLAESRQLIEKNEGVISFLNSKLNDAEAPSMRAIMSVPPPYVPSLTVPRGGASASLGPGGSVGLSSTGGARPYASAYVPSASVGAGAAGSSISPPSMGVPSGSQGGNIPIQIQKNAANSLVTQLPSHREVPRSSSLSPFVRKVPSFQTKGDGSPQPPGAPPQPLPPQNAMTSPVNSVPDRNGMDASADNKPSLYNGGFSSNFSAFATPSFSQKPPEPSEPPSHPHGKEDLPGWGSDFNPNAQPIANP